MAINRDNVTNRIIGKLPSMGIDTQVGNDESHTVKLVRAIVDEILNEITSNGEVIVIQANSIGIGNMGSPVNSNLVNRGKGIIR